MLIQFIDTCIYFKELSGLDQELCYDWLVSYTFWTFAQQYNNSLNLSERILSKGILYSEGILGEGILYPDGIMGEEILYLEGILGGRDFAPYQEWILSEGILNPEGILCEGILYQEGILSHSSECKRWVKWSQKYWSLVG